jgi:hypothetical protein
MLGRADLGTQAISEANPAGKSNYGACWNGEPRDHRMMRMLTRGRATPAVANIGTYGPCSAFIKTATIGELRE